MAQPTKAEIIDLMVELGGLPKIVENMDARLARVERTATEGREAAIRVEMRVNGIEAQGGQLAASIVEIAKMAAANQKDIAVQGERLSGLVKIVWTLGVPVAMILLKTLVDLAIRFLGA